MTRNRITALAATALTVLGVCVAAAAAGASGPQPPQSDPFYRPPSGWASDAPGTILRTRPVQLAAFAILPQKIESWQLLYRSTSSDGAPMPAVTTVLLPAGGKPKALLSYQIAEDASAPQCAMSYTLQLGGPKGELVNQAELLLIDAAVASGLAVSVPDYEGPDGEFGAAEQPGYAILDGLRAAEQFAPLGLPGRSTPTAIWGYSGGSLASGWAAQVQPGYAPDLDVRGVAVGGFATNLGQALLKINGGFGAGLIASALPGVLKSDPVLAAVVEPYLTPAGKALLAHSGQQCMVANIAQYAFTNFNRYLTKPIAALLADPAVKAALDRHDLGASTPTAPMFVYQAVHDELIPVAGVDTIVKNYCAHGDAVTYTRDELSEHTILAFAGAPAALHWLIGRVGSTSNPQGCSTRTVPTMALLPAALTTWPTFLRGDLLALLDQPVGAGLF